MIIVLSLVLISIYYTLFFINMDFVISEQETWGIFIIKELIKLGIIGIGGALFKFWLDHTQKQRELNRIELTRQHSIRTDLVQKSAKIFSIFFEIEKKYYAICEGDSLLVGKNNFEIKESIKHKGERGTNEYRQYRDNTWLPNDSDFKISPSYLTNPTIIDKKIQKIQELIFQAAETEAMWGTLMVEILENYNGNIPNLNNTLKDLGNYYKQFRKGMHRGIKFLDEPEDIREDIKEKYQGVLTILREMPIQKIPTQ